MHNFKNLEVWNMSLELSVAVYKMTAAFPVREQYGITSQMNRSAVSIASNIAEGSGRRTEKDFKHFLRVSLGSSFELETQLIIANKVGLINDADMQAMHPTIISIRKMLYTLQKQK